MKGSLFADVLRNLDSNSNYDWKRVVCEIAEAHPEVVAKCIVQYTKKDAWKGEVRRKALESDSKVPPLKLMRELTGAGLKDARDWIESDPECCRNGGWVLQPVNPNNPFK